jgi:hypothetical protein
VRTLLVLVVLVALVAILIGASLGAYGALVTCGADGAEVCVAWPAVVSGATWVMFLAFFAGLAAWQVRVWRQSASPVPPDKDGTQDG